MGPAGPALLPAFHGLRGERIWKIETGLRAQMGACVPNLTLPFEGSQKTI